jgi:hypothetical protein
MHRSMHLFVVLHTVYICGMDLSRADVQQLAGPFADQAALLRPALWQAVRGQT